MQTADVREQMIEQQVRAWDVLDERVLDAMRRMPRELFVPDERALSAPTRTPRCRCRAASTCCARAWSGGCCRPCCRSPRSRCSSSARAPGFVTACLHGMAGGGERPRAVPGARRERARQPGRPRGARRGSAGCGRLRYESATRYDVIAVTASLPLYDARFERAAERRRTSVHRRGRSPGDGSAPGAAHRRAGLEHPGPVRNRHRPAGARGTSAGIYFLAPRMPLRALRQGLKETT